MTNLLKNVWELFPPFSREPLLQYVFFHLDHSENKPNIIKKNRLLIFSAAVFFAVVLISISQPLLSKFFLSENIFWINSLTHSIFENFGSIISIIIGLILCWEYLASGKINVLFLMVAFFSMGVLDVFHSFSSYCHNQFVWFHTCSAFWGSVFFFISFFFQNDIKGNAIKSVWSRRFSLFAGILLVFAFSFLSNEFYYLIPDVLKVELPHHTPVTEVSGDFSNFIHMLNWVACVFFLLSGIFFVKGFIKSNDVIYLIFGISAMLFFVSELSFTFSRLWDPVWWYWHIIKVIIFSGLLIGLAYGFSQTFYGLHLSKIKLSNLLQEIERKNTEIMKAYERLKETQRYLIESEKLASIGKIAASVAHEIRNPLGAITNSIGVLRRYNPSSFEDIELFEIVEKEIDRLNKLVEDFLSYSKPSRLNKEETDIHVLINDTLSVLKMDRKIRPNFQIESLFGSDVPLLKLDKNKIKQVLLNLYYNALQAMPANSGILKVMTGYNKIEDEVEITLSDNGIGMTEEVLLRIFEPFFSTKDKGMGLGLNIVHKIVTEHGGYILISSKESKGTKITIKFPVVFKDVSLEKAEGISEKSWNY